MVEADCAEAVGGLGAESGDLGETHEGGEGAGHGYVGGAGEGKPGGAHVAGLVHR